MCGVLIKNIIYSNRKRQIKEGYIIVNKQKSMTFKRLKSYLNYTVFFSKEQYIMPQWCPYKATCYHS